MPRLVRWRDQILDVADRDRIDAGERFVEQHVIRPRRQRARDLDAAPLAAGQRDRRRLAQARDVELVEQASSSASRFFLLGLDHFEHRADVLLDRQAAEDRGFLRQIADAEPGALVHRQLGDVVAVELDGAVIRLDQAGDHVEHGGLAGAVRTEQADRLAAADIDADAAHDLAGAKALFHAMHSQKSGAPQQLGAAGAVGLGRPRRLVGGSF